MTHPVRLIVTWRAAIEAAARRADIAVAGPYSQDDTVHHRRVATLKQLVRNSPTQHKWLLRRLLLFDKATARGNGPSIQQHGTQLVAIWEAVAKGAATHRGARSVHKSEMPGSQAQLVAPTPGL